MEGTGQPPVGWRDLVEAIPGNVAVQAGGEFVYASEGFGAAVGAGVDRIVGEHWSVLFDRGEAARLGRGIEQARTGGRWEGEVCTGGRHADGAWVVLALSGAERGTVVWMATDRDPARGDGRATGRGSRRHVRPEFARSVLDAVDDAVYVVGGDGRLCLWNRALAETTGYGDAEIDGMRVAELVPRDQRGRLSGAAGDVDAVGGRRIEADLLTADGERIPHEFRETAFEDPETGETFRCGVVRDVTEREGREVTTIGRPDGVLDDLTDRQREVLEAAYRAGYFAWPRDSTAQEVAEALGIAPPTLHGHLRKAEGTLLGELF